MKKSPTLDLSETNIAGLGTELEKKVRLEAAQTEKAWEGAGKKPGLKVWRIEQFKVVPWPETDYGKFHTGDSYIVLNTYKLPNSDALRHDIHFWLGLETTQDEAGTAAYKTVELDDYLGTTPVQHREIQGFESLLFLSYFKVFQILEGGTETGFRHVETNAQSFQPRLLHIYSIPPTVPRLPKTRPIHTLLVKQVPVSMNSLNSGDVFVLDLGKEILQWNGSKASGVERNKAAEYVRKLDDERKDAKVSVFDETDADVNIFYGHLGGKTGPIASAAEGETRTLSSISSFEKLLFRLSNASGPLEFTQEAKGNVSKSQLKSDDVFVFDCGPEVFVWVGKGADKEERRRSMQYALEYIKKYERPATLPVTRLLDGSENQVFWDAFDA
ncbi:uncharacterized protein SPPG_06272 [Spizellomyces punctatus DAOM BR117]|uniref:Gelsolin-like domain-containing protein n=1 Tax=Spizellomyces punctatus (strain DAOM BR117) TaxID=645134 RepID=A0A0L0HBN1_SPIPD|nr:uncharacterized protein SPPG_06272 [Spizellomyces punctatus DAOM BR117]KNC98587.1 hypothetical protein SPPG_06272 [Spizellomyces punctatus DAOM BR117]|eukprot:XP_016606627.1 hypothetical protein SPPG_06272 [Spizellomyces punctatus DAOM BR117]